MPFKETCRVEERVRMLSDYETGNWSVSDLCRRYGVCRDTFYEWRKRRESGGLNWFVDRSHAPLHCPHETAGTLADVIVSLRKRFPHLGPRKLLAILERQAPETCWPAASTIGGILKQAGLITPIKRRRRAIDQKRPVTAVAAANDEWATDFKGWFRTTDRSPDRPTDDNGWPQSFSDRCADRAADDRRIAAGLCRGISRSWPAAFDPLR